MTLSTRIAVMFGEMSSSWARRKKSTIPANMFVAGFMGAFVHLFPAKVAMEARRPEWSHPQRPADAQAKVRLDGVNDVAEDGTRRHARHRSSLHPPRLACAKSAIHNKQTQGR